MKPRPLVIRWDSTVNPSRPGWTAFFISKSGKRTTALLSTNPDHDLDDLRDFALTMLHAFDYDSSELPDAVFVIPQRRPSSS